MGYGGYLLKIGDYKVPQKFMKAESYKAYVNMQDVDDYTDANGYLHRNAVKLKVAKIEFETPEMLSDTEFRELMSNIQKGYLIPKARQCEITAYIPEYGDYVTQTAYLADLEPQIYWTKANTLIQYKPIRFAFIGGVYSD